jgi:hypothetical protein
MKWTRPLERFLEVPVAVWLSDIFFHRPGGRAVRQKVRRGENGQSEAVKVGVGRTSHRPLVPLPIQNNQV